MERSTTSWAERKTGAAARSRNLRLLDGVAGCLVELHAACAALAALCGLMLLRGDGHQPGCACKMCPGLRRACAAADLWRTIQ